MTGGIREGVNMEKDGDSEEDNDEVVVKQVWRGDLKKEDRKDEVTKVNEEKRRRSSEEEVIRRRRMRTEEKSILRM